MMILCLGDSSGMPRPGLPLVNTWPYVLSKLSKKISGYDLIPIFRRACTTDMILDGDSLEFYQPDIVIMQLGIADCAPRYLKKSRVLHKIITLFPARAQSLFWKFWKIFFKRTPKEAWVSPSKFRENLKSYLERCIACNVQSVVLIKIATPGEQMRRKNNHIAQSVSVYNSIYDELERLYPFVKLVHPLTGEDDIYMDDGYHPNEKGNAKIAKILAEVLLISPNNSNND